MFKLSILISAYKERNLIFRKSKKLWYSKKQFPLTF